MLPYGVIFALSYQFAHAIDNYLFKSSTLSWWANQSRFLLIFVCLSFPLALWYYKSPLVLGEYDLLGFATQIYLATLIVVVPLMLYGRRRIEQLRVKINGQVVLRGENKRDLLQLPLQDILYIETARNYVEVHYRQDGRVQKKLLRTTLKKIAGEHPKLIQIHRSYLVNPGHITGWTGPKSIKISTQEIPVSDSYRAQLVDHFKTRP
jgi:hypothetical protein